MFHFIFDYNYGNFWEILLLETGIITLPNMYKLCHFNLTTSPLYVVKLKNNTKTAARLLQLSVEPIVPKFYRKSFNVRFLPHLLAVFQQKSFYILVGFIKNLS